METEPRLHEQITQLKDFLLNKGYAHETLKPYSRCWSRLTKYANENGYESFSPTLGSDFLQYEYGVNDIERPTQNEKSPVRAIRLLTTFLQTGNLAAYQKRNSSLPFEFEDISNRYLNHLQNLGQQPKSLKTKQSRVRIFLLYLSGYGMKSINELTKTDLLRFMNDLKNKYSSAGRGNILYTIKDFLIFCASFDAVDNKLPLIIKGIYTNPNEKLPTVYSTDEIKLILESVNRDTSEGKRDYAVLLLAAILGLRSSDIINIKLEDIKWSNNVLEFYQKKTGVFAKLPLPENVKIALKDYIENCRQVTEYDNLFIRTRAPIIPYKDTVTIFEIVSKYIDLSGITVGNRNHGPHSLRHSLASGMLENKTSLPVIAAALGHNNTKNTSRYIRIDIDLLRSVALEVPL